MAPFRKRGGGVDDPASSIRMSAMCGSWWHEGNRNGLRLYRELRAQGYTGSSKAIYRYLERLRTPHRPLTPSKAHKRKRVLASPALLQNFSAQRASLSVCVSTREAGRGTAPGTGVDPTSQSECRGRVPPGWARQKRATCPSSSHWPRAFAKTRRLCRQA